MTAPYERIAQTLRSSVLRLRLELRRPLVRSGTLARLRSLPRDIRSDDTFIVSYPRSGSSWLRRLVATLLDSSTQWTVQNIDEAIPHVYAPTSVLARAKSPRYLKSHQPYQPAYPKVLYLYRDPRDVLLSYHNFYRTILSHDLTLDEFTERFLNGTVQFGRWDDHVDSWMFGRRNGQFMGLAYERLHGQTKDALEEVARFLGINASEQSIDAALQRCTFERHTRDVLSQQEFRDKGYAGGVQGGAGKWRAQLPPALADRVWKRLGKTMGRLSYPIS